MLCIDKEGHFLSWQYPQSFASPAGIVAQISAQLLRFPLGVTLAHHCQARGLTGDLVVQVPNLKGSG